jgi:DNA-binding NarL/FixJ family response regulator
MINVLIADDHAVMRNGIKHLCEDMGDVVVAGEAENGREVMALLAQHQFDLVLLDLTMPDVSGVELVGRIRARDAKLPILIFSMRNEFHVAKLALQAGANGYFCKGSKEKELIAAIRAVAAGGRFVDQAIVEQSMFETTVRKSGVSLHENLSPRELEVMKLIAQGLSLKEIGEKLMINVKTVSMHKQKIMAKMTFKNNAELVFYVTENGLNKPA